MATILYDANGTPIKFSHPIDAKEAMATGKYSIVNPNAPKREEPPAEPEKEEDIDMTIAPLDSDDIDDEKPQSSASRGRPRKNP